MKNTKARKDPSKKRSSASKDSRAILIFSLASPNLLPCYGKNLTPDGTSGLASAFGRPWAGPCWKLPNDLLHRLTWKLSGLIFTQAYHRRNLPSLTVESLRKSGSLNKRWAERA